MTQATAVPRNAWPATPRPSLRQVFLTAMRSEWTKLRTVRSTAWAAIFTVLSTVGLGALLTALEVGRWDNRSAVEAANFDPLFYSLVGLNLTQLSVGVLGVLVMTSEYATGAITLTFGATPQRRLLLGTKVATFSAAVAMIGLVSCFAAFFLCQAILARKDAGVSITDPGVLRAVLGGAVHLVLIGAVAVGVGAALRRTAGAVALLFAVLLVLPGIVMLLPSPWDDSVTKYLPNSAGDAMSAVVRFPNMLAPAAGLLVLCTYVAVMLLGDAVALRRRDA